MQNMQKLISNIIFFNLDLENEWSGFYNFHFGAKFWL